MGNDYPQSFRDQLVQEVRELRKAAWVDRRRDLRERLVQRWVSETARAGRFLVPDPAAVADAPRPYGYRELRT